MSEDLARLLRRFTPQNRGLDRDALMFEAGRASVPSPMRWKALTAVFALGQVLTLLLLLFQPARVAPQTESPQPAVAPGWSPTLTPSPSALEDTWAAYRHLGEFDLNRPPSVTTADVLPDGPPLRAFTSLD